MPFPQFHSLLTVVVLLLPGIAVISACWSGNATVERAGRLSIVAEEVLHHGAFNPDGPNRTITPLGNIRVIVTDTTMNALDTVFTNAEGHIALDLAPGVYVLVPQEREYESAPGSSPSEQRIEIIAGGTATVLLQYQIFAP